ncbi:hypothetical protein, partial [Achromobacter insuavis]|uniref:hypothetical protein n=1 Tax=Achromobacter insuavis TaxID=1287735 RepID=UPI002402C395
MSATTADMAASTSAMPASAPAARRDPGPAAALRLLPHAFAIAGVAQRAAAVVGARAVTRGGRIAALALRGRL